MFPAIKQKAHLGYQPRWSVMIPTFNPTSYLERTLQSVIEQGIHPQNMQIEIVDDCSYAGNVDEIISKLGLNGRVAFFRQEKNVGLAENWNTCINRAQGELVHILHQDDYILPGFYDVLGQSFLTDDDIGAAFCRCQVLDEANQKFVEREILQNKPGVLSNWLEYITTKNRILTPSIVVRRKVYECLGGYCPELYFALDWEMWIRISNSYKVWYEPRILATYRTHGESETANLGRSAKTIKDIQHSFAIRASYLPVDLNKRTERTARRNYARFAFRHGSNFLDNHQWGVGQKFLVEGIKCGKDSYTIYELLRTLGYFILKRILAHSRNILKIMGTV